MGKKKFSWITSQLKQKIRKRDFLKKKAIQERKTAGLDKIPCKLLKIAAEIVALSLPQIFDTIHKLL